MNVQQQPTPCSCESIEDWRYRLHILLKHYDVID